MHRYLLVGVLHGVLGVFLVGGNDATVRPVVYNGNLNFESQAVTRGPSKLNIPLCMLTLVIG